MWFAVLMLTGLAVYWNGLRIEYYSDDFLFLFDPNSDMSRVLLGFVHHRFFRPIENLLVSTIQRWVGLETWPIHTLSLAMHCSMSFLVYRAALALGLRLRTALIASAFMLVSQANAMAVLSNDALSQVGSTLFGHLSLFLLYSYLWPGLGQGTADRAVTGRYAGSVLAYLASLLFKESGVSFFAPAVGLIAVARGIPRILRPNPVAFREAAVFVAVTILYMAGRRLIGAAQPSFGGARYHFGLGVNIVENLAQLGLAMFLPASTVDAFTAMATRDATALAAIGTASAVLVVVIVVGLWRASSWRMVGVLAAGAVALCFPIALLNHISELYAYNTMPVISLLVGIALSSLLTGGVAARAVAGATLVLLLVSHVTATQRKAMLMARNGERATALLAQVTARARLVPPNGRLILLNPEGPRADYSVFRVSAFNVLRFGEYRVKQLARRADIDVVIVEPERLTQLEPGAAAVILTLRDGEVVPYR
jgi:hypothetical protein